MLSHFVGRDFRLHQEFEVAGKFYAPTTGVLNLNLVAQDGSQLHSFSLPVTEPLNWVITGNNFSLEIDERFKFVFLTVDFMSEEGPKTWSQTLRLIRFKPITINSMRVIQELGAFEDEIASDLIDPYQAYCDLSDKLGTDLFQDPKKAPEANKAILAHIVLQLLPTLSLKLKASHAIDDQKFSRQRVDTAALTEHYSVMLFRTLADHFGYEDTTAYEPLITMVSRTDPFTGE